MSYTDRYHIVPGILSNSGPGGSPKHILIADDSDTVRSVIRFFLEAHKDLYICGEAVDGVDAIEKAKTLEPDLILLDIAMPRMNGAEAAPILKRDLPHTRIIVFTMYSEAIGKSLAPVTGVDLVLSKPDGMGQLIKGVQTLLGCRTALPTS